jgi:hypothetical protein
MTVPASPLLHTIGALVNSIDSFGSFPPTEKLRDRFGVTVVYLNHADPKATREQMDGIRSHRVAAGSWEPVPDPPSLADGVALAAKVSARVGELGSDAVYLNLEGLSIQQIRDFLWGRPGSKGYRGSNGVVGTTDGLRPRKPTLWGDEPFKDGSVKPLADLVAARMMLAPELFMGDMGAVDWCRVVLDLATGFRASGPAVAEDRVPPEQIVATYDAANLPKQRIRKGILFTAERLPGISA